MATLAFDGSFVNQHHRDIVPDWVDTIALQTLQARRIRAEFQTAFTVGADQNIE